MGKDAEHDLIYKVLTEEPEVLGNLSTASGARGQGKP
jgi:hypothetical protein